MKKLRVTFISFLLVSSLYARVDYYVDPSGTDDLTHGSGTGTDAWATIQYAVDHVANPTTASVVINISADVYTLNNSVIIVNRSFTDLSLSGSGRNNTFIQAAAVKTLATSGIFEIMDGNVVTISDLSIRNGYNRGILNQGTLTIEDCSIFDINGKGIYNDEVLGYTGHCSINHCLIYNNSSNGVFSYQFGAILTLEQSVIYNNQSNGIMCSGTATILNSTISGNNTTGYGGGIDARDCNLTINSCTIVNNSSTLGGGLYHATGNLNIKNSIIANNSATTSNDISLFFSTLNSQDYNLFEDISGLTIFGTTTHNIYNQDPNFGPLANNGGSTLTHALLSGSPAINQIPASSPNGAPSTDQRGYARVGDYDMGAFEAPDYSLSVSLSSFTVKVVDNSVELYWTTESEVDNVGYILERKRENDFEWATIADYHTNEKLKGNGNTSSRVNYNFTDYNVTTDQIYSYRLKDVDTDGLVTILDIITVQVKTAEESDPVHTKLNPVFPNPFNPHTKISYELEKEMAVNLTIYNLLGRQVRILANKEQQSSGIYNLYWDGKNNMNEPMPSGTYILVIKTDHFVESQKLILVR